MKAIYMKQQLKKNLYKKEAIPFQPDLMIKITYSRETSLLVKNHIKIMFLLK